MKRLIHRVWQLIENIIRLFIIIFWGLMKKEVTSELIDGVVQFFKFGIVGVSNTIISYLIYVLSLFGFQKFELFKKSDYIISQFIAFFLSVLWSFYWNNIMVFVEKKGKERCIWKTLLKTYIAYSFTGLFLNSILIVLWVKVLHVSEFIAPLINLFISVPLNFLINKFWAFK